MEGLTLGVNGKTLSNHNMTDCLKDMSNTHVSVSFHSEYATITPMGDCADIDAHTLSQHLTSLRLLKYKSICIHRKGLRYTVIIS